MSKSVLIFGQSFSPNSDFLTISKDYNRTPLLADQAHDAENFIDWNRISPISARSMLLAAENKFTNIEEVIIIFDGNEFASKTTSVQISDFTKAIDMFITSYAYVCSELLSRSTKNKNMHVVFLLKQVSVPANPIKSLIEEPVASLPICMAQAAFASLAENMQALGNIDITLAKSETESDEEIAHWLFSFLDNLKDKKMTGWLKVGSKGSGLLSLFR
ncbi:MAG: hypothetical protein ACRC4W_04345 [Treponemataceae bacterium]